MILGTLDEAKSQPLLDCTKLDDTKIGDLGWRLVEVRGVEPLSKTALIKSNYVRSRLFKFNLAVENRHSTHQAVLQNLIN